MGEWQGLGQFPVQPAPARPVPVVWPAPCGDAGSHAAWRPDVLRGTGGADWQSCQASCRQTASGSSAPATARLTNRRAGANSPPLPRTALLSGAIGMVCCCSSVVERILGKAEVGSSILPSSTIPLLPTLRIARCCAARQDGAWGLAEPPAQFGNWGIS